MGSTALSTTTEAKEGEGYFYPETPLDPSKPLIHQLIPRAMDAIGHIGKNRTSAADGKYQFRGIDDVYLKCQPVFTRFGIYCAQRVVQQLREERRSRNGGALFVVSLTVEHHFTASDGSEIVVTTIGEGMDTSDKAANKAMSVAMKYAIFGLFSIPTQDPDNDPETQRHEVAHGNDWREDPRNERTSAPPQSKRTDGPRELSAAESRKFDAPPVDELAKEISACVNDLGVAKSRVEVEAAITRIAKLPKADREKLRPMIKAQLAKFPKAPTADRQPGAAQ